MDDDQLLACNVRLPKHVLFRPVEEEGMILDLETEAYLGLNPSARFMLETIVEAPSIADGLARLGKHYEATEATLKTDLLAFVRQLSARGLVDIAMPVGNDVG